jgi:LacI family transcriptional regulator
MSSINIKDIARISGVGVSTVSRVINNHPDVNADTREKVLAIIKEYNYVPNNSARNLRLTHSHAIAVLVKGITNPFFSPLIKILDQEISRMGYAMLMHQVDFDADEIDVALELVKEKNLEGIIFLGGKFYHQEEKLALLDVPFVMCTSTTPTAHCISIDDFKESYNAIDYLCTLGHRQIAILVPNQDESIGDTRLAGYLQALKDHQIPVEKDLIKYFHSELEDYSLQNGYLCTKELLESDTPFTAIFAPSDVLAIGAYKAIFEKGKKIPEDYSVLGFDNIELADYIQPPLTTIAQPIEQIAFETVKLLFKIMHAKKTSQPTHKVFGATLVKRSSCRAIKK